MEQSGDNQTVTEEELQRDMVAIFKPKGIWKSVNMDGKVEELGSEMQNQINEERKRECEDNSTRIKD